MLLDRPAHAVDRRALLETWVQKAGKLAEGSREDSERCGNAKVFFFDNMLKQSC